MLGLDQFIAELNKSISMFLPETALVIAFLVALLLDLMFKKSKNLTGYTALIGFLVTGYFLFKQMNMQSTAFSNMFVIDQFGIFMKWVILLSSIGVVLISFFTNELYEKAKGVGEYFTLIIGMAFGMFLLVGSSNLIIIYLAIETMSLSSYVLAGYTKEVKRASEASLKYVIFGAVSSGIMIYGISILFGLTGSLNLFEINRFLAANPVNNFALFLSVIMILSGFGYKISAVPFHFWTPDVYEGAPVPITAYLSVASKAAGFAILLRFFKVTFLDSVPGNDSVWTLLGSIDWHFVIAILAVLSMTLGNLVALWQTNVKRILAYSSIAHAGYMLMAVSTMDDAGVASVLIYFFMYMVMNLGAFYVVALIANNIGSEEIDDYNGLGYRAPILGICMTLFLISLTGLPPTAGFIGKLYVFSAVVKAGYIWLAVVGVINSVISLFYYVKIFRNMYLNDVDSNKSKLTYSPASIVLLFVFAIPTLYLGIFFNDIVKWASYSANIFMGK